MSPGSHVLVELVIVLGTAAVVAVVFQAIRLPAVLGYVLAGLLIGPHVPVPLVADPALVGVLSELGVIFLMFSIGLELRVGTLGRVGLAAGLTAVIEVAAMVTIGTLVGRALGWSDAEALFAGACVAISSTMLVARSFEDLGLRGGFTELVFAVLVFEDLLAIILLAILTAVASGAGLSAAALASMIARLAGFLAVVITGGLIVVPRLIRLVARLGRPDTLVVTAVAVCVGMAALAEAAGYSVALGAFLGGMFIAESGKGHEVGRAVRPFRDVFAAIFFVSIGMTVDPAAMLDHAAAIVTLTAAVLLGKPLGVAVGAFVAGNGLGPAIRSGLSLAQIGELSFVMAGIGVAGGVVSDALLPVVVGVSCLTTLVSPVLIRRSERIAAGVAARLPRRVATFVSFYEAWLGRLRRRPASDPGARRLRRFAIMLGVDAIGLAAVVIAATEIHARIEAWLATTGLSRDAARGIVIAAAIGLGLVFLVGVIRRAASLAGRLADEVFPRRDPLDLGRAPRRALAVTFEIAIALAVGAPLAAVTQPFIPGGAVIVLAAVVVLVVLARRSIADLDGHVRAGSELLVELLAPAAPGAPPTPDVEAVMPGLSDVVAVTVAPGTPAVGRSLAELDLRARTGASVLAIRRGATGLPAPPASERLCAGDVLAVAGSAAAVDAARAVLLGEGLSSPDPSPAPSARPAPATSASRGWTR